MVQQQMAPVRQSATDRSILNERRQAHLLRAAGRSRREICQTLKRSRSTIGDWLREPMPSEVKLEHAPDGDKRSSHKIYLMGELDERFRNEAVRQDCSRSQIAAMAIRFYLDAMDRYRSGGKGDLHLYGVRH
ncbi:MAG: hypothetical protein WBM08_14990 [Prochlorococcaceae cyanobacterium]